MFCIAAFIVFVVVGIFSVRYRRLAKKAWSCVARKITFRPCEIGFKEDTKNLLIGKLIFTRPRLAKFLDKWIEFFATIFVVLSVWSLVVVLQSGLYLFVYDTCTPKNAESCSLGGESCGITSDRDTFVDAVTNLSVLTWVKDEAIFFAETMARVPDQFKNWTPEEYLNGNETYYLPFDSGKKLALEIIDPGCKFCAKLFVNIKKALFEQQYNLTYVPYAIPDESTQSGYKFPNSPLVISYLEATKLHPLNSETPADWQILERLFLGEAPDGRMYQEKFNLLYSHEEAEAVLISWLREMGYKEDQIEKIRDTSRADVVAKKVDQQIEIVEKHIKTIKIPTIIFDGKRYDRVIAPEKLI